MSLRPANFASASGTQVEEYEELDDPLNADMHEVVARGAHGARRAERCLESRDSVPVGGAKSQQ
jgi:hypothetical protein